MIKTLTTRGFIYREPGTARSIVYDLALYRSFRYLRPPDEQVELATAHLQRGV